MKNVILILMLIFLVSANNYAHEKKKHEKHSRDKSMYNTDSVKTIDSIMLYEKNSELMKSGHLEEITEIKIPDMIFEHMHNKIVHFTLALSLTAFLFTLLNFKWPQFEWTIKIMVVLSAAAGAASYFTGISQAAVFHGESIEWLVSLHRIYGTVSEILLLLWALFLFAQSLKKYAWIIGAAIFILVSITGFYGGIIALS